MHLSRRCDSSDISGPAARLYRRCAAIAQIGRPKATSLANMRNFKSEAVDYLSEIPHASALSQMILHTDLLHSHERFSILKDRPFRTFTIEFHKVDLASEAL